MGHEARAAEVGCRESDGILEDEVARLVGSYRREALASPGGARTFRIYGKLKAAVRAMHARDRQCMQAGA